MTELDLAYQNALDYIYSFIDYSLTRNFRYSPEKFNLDRMAALLDLLGNPQQRYPIIHVAGTKGKGSVSALMASSLRAAGYTTGLYTSPHLQEYTERIQVNGQEILPGEFVALIEEIKPYVARVERLTTFEITTALGFLYFARQHVNAAVIEVGLGGRLDATNVIDPLVSVITSISYDHTAVLGNTLAQIATEKAGIIKSDRPVVVSPQKDEARITIEQIAAAHSAPLTQVGRDLLFAPWTHSLESQTILLWDADRQPLVDAYIESGGQTPAPLTLKLPLLGYHQIENAATAYAAIEVARCAGLQISDEAVQEGFSRVKWPGRFEVLRFTPPVIVDSAHNRDSALKLRLTIEDYLPGVPVILVYGASEDKDIHGMFAELLPRARRVIATQSIHPRAAGADQLVELAHRFGCPAEAILPVESALARALELAGNDAAVLVTGSLFVAAAARQAWQMLRDPGQV